MQVHNHKSEDGDVGVMHISRQEAQDLVEVISNSLLQFPETENFTVTLGVFQEPVEDETSDSEGSDAESI